LILTKSAFPQKQTKLLKEGGFLFFTSSIGKGLDLLRGTVFLKLFSPADFGIIDIVNQIVSLSKYADIGLLNNVQREYNYDQVTHPTLAKERKEKAYGFELIITLALFFLLFFTGFYIEKSTEVKVGIIFGAVSFLFTKGLKFMGMDMTLTKKFKQFAHFSLVSNVVQNVLILSTVTFIGIYAPLVVKSIALLLVFVYFYYVYGIKFNFKFDHLELKRQLKYGLFFSGTSILFGLWVFFERFLITHYFSLAEVGMYAASLFLLKMGTSLLDEFIKPVSIRVKQSLAKVDIEIIKKYVLYPSLLFLFLCLPIIYFAEFLINFIEVNYLTNFKGIGKVFATLKWLIPCYGVGSFSGYLLLTKGVDRFIPVYFITLIRFLLVALLCYLYPPVEFTTLLVYLVCVELLYFYSKQFLIFSKFFNTRLTFLMVSVFLLIQQLLLFNL
jgi:hypothetical protein